MRVAVLQHVPFEGLGSIEPWLQARGAEVGWVRLQDGDPLPSVPAVDWVIALGGPMSVNQEEAYPWLVEEKRFVRDAIEGGKVVLGICLGAQLIASALGSRVFSNGGKEIGWYPVEPTADAANSPFRAVFDAPFPAFHWHGETFRIPPGATHLARTLASANQAFALGDRVLGLQFHLETTPEVARALCEHCGDDLAPAAWVQGRLEILRDGGRYAALNRRMDAVLDLLAGAGS